MMIEIVHETQGSREAYNRIFSEQGLTRHLDSYYLWALGLLRPRRGRRLLDMSCGAGQLLRFAAEMGLDSYGLDISDVAARLAKDAAPRAKVIVGDGEGLPFPDGAFDYLINLGSLEHYQNPKEGAREIARVLKGDGEALILLPNAFGLLWNIACVLQTGDVCDDSQPIQRYATLNEWRRLLEENGLSIQRVQGYERPLPRTRDDWVWYLRHPHKLLTRIFLIPFIPLPLASNLAYICRKARKGGKHG